MAPTGSRQEEKSRYEKRGEHKKQHKHYVWEKPRHTKRPCAVCLQQFLSHLLWITSATLLTSFIFPLTSDSPKTSFLFQEWWLLCCNLWNKQLLKEGCSEFSVDLLVMQLCQKRIIHRTILWNRMMRIRYWTITISLLSMYVHNFSSPEEVVSLLPREEKKQAG